MADADLVWSGDLSLGPTGDLALVDGPPEGQQRVLRRLLTNLLDYTWQPSYGGGLGGYVGEVTGSRTIEGAIRGQLFAEATVAHSPPPVVSAASLPDGSVFVDLKYADRASASAQFLTFSVGV